MTTLIADRVNLFQRHQADAYEESQRHALSMGTRRHRLIDADGSLLDLVNP
jgi:hypothetical protein